MVLDSRSPASVARAGRADDIAIIAASLLSLPADTLLLGSGRRGWSAAIYIGASHPHVRLLRVLRRPARSQHRQARMGLGWCVTPAPGHVRRGRDRNIGGSPTCLPAAVLSRALLVALHPRGSAGRHGGGHGRRSRPAPRASSGRPPLAKSDARAHFRRWDEDSASSPPSRPLAALDPSVRDRLAAPRGAIHRPARRSGDGATSRSAAREELARRQGRLAGRATAAVRNRLAARQQPRGPSSKRSPPRCAGGTRRAPRRRAAGLRCALP